MKLILLPCFRCVTKLVIIFGDEQYDKYQSRISRCISEGLCEEDQGFPTFLMHMKNPWKREWKRVLQLIVERKGRKVDENECAQSVQASECEGNKNSDLEKVTESETFAEEQTEQSWTRGASQVQRAQTTDSTEEKVQEEQVHGSDQNKRLFIKWLEIMFVISAKRSIAKLKRKKIQKQKTKIKMIVLEHLTFGCYHLSPQFRQVLNEVHMMELRSKGNMAKEWFEVSNETGKLLRKSKEEANSKHKKKDQTNDWDEIYKKGKDILYLLEAAGKINRVTAIQLAMAARDKNKKALFGEMEIEGSEDDGEESMDVDFDIDSDSYNHSDSDSDSDCDSDSGQLQQQRQ
jgi:hypothetical protein